MQIRLRRSEDESMMLPGSTPYFVYGGGERYGGLVMAHLYHYHYENMAGRHAFAVDLPRQGRKCFDRFLDAWKFLQEHFDNI